LIEFIDKAADFSVCCSECKGEWGCALCLYRTHCDELNDGLLTPLGAPFRKLTEIIQKKELDTTSTQVPTIPAPSTPTVTRSPLGNITNTLNSPRNVKAEEKYVVKTENLIDISLL
jgi:hypothetical protein